jgi:hypothetical protein
LRIATTTAADYSSRKMIDSPKLTRRSVLGGICTALAIGCGTRGEGEGAEPMAPPEYIGTATMRADGTIVLDLGASIPGGGGGIAHGRIEYPPGHPQRDEVLAHLGGLAPGETKDVRPWPTE